MKFESIPIFLFYGNRGDEILAMRDKVLDAILPRETRNENLTEIYSTQGGTVSLAKSLPEIMADFDTMSFIPDATKCVIVTNPEEMMGSGGRSKKKKGDGGQNVVDWVTKVLPKTGHHMIVLGFEDEGAGREVEESSGLYQAIQQIGYSKRFREVLYFKIEDGLLGRQINVVLEAVRTLWKPGKGGDMRVYNALTRSIRFMLQANLDKDPRIRRDPNLKSTLLPMNKSMNLYKSSPTVQRKYLQIQRYRTQDLLEAYETLTQVYQAMRPRSDAAYVPDPLGILEQMLSKLMLSPDPMSR